MWTRVGSKQLCSVLRCYRTLNCAANPFPIIPSTAIPSSQYKEQNMLLYERLAAKRLQVISQSEGRADRVKLTVRERLKLLADEGSEMLEIGLLSGLGLEYGDVPCAGNAVCIVEVCGEKCVVSANDWTIKGGCSFPITLKKQLRAQEIAWQNRLPCIYLVDSGGAFLPLQVCQHIMCHSCHCSLYLHRVRYIQIRNTGDACFVMRQSSLPCRYLRYLTSDV